jgi:hypothetical protein
LWQSGGSSRRNSTTLLAATDQGNDRSSGNIAIHGAQDRAMALVYRNGRPYLYRSVRRDGRVTSEYVACGAAALLLAQGDRLIHDMKTIALPEDPEERQQRDELERALDTLAADARARAHAALIEAGYHQHKRGEWRRRRGNRA